MLGKGLRQQAYLSEPLRSVAIGAYLGPHTYLHPPFRTTLKTSLAFLSSFFARWWDTQPPPAAGT